MNFEQQIIDLNQKINDLRIQLDNVLRFSAPQRLICVLKHICQRHHLNAKEFILPMTKGRLALLVGIEQETVSRTIHRLEQYGVSISGKTASFHDGDKIRRTVCDHCAGRDSCAAFKWTENPTAPVYPLAAAPQSLPLLQHELY